MPKLCEYLISDTMGDITFSRNWNVLRHDENRHIVDELPKGVVGIHLVSCQSQQATYVELLDDSKLCRQVICLDFLNVG